ncbi:MAG: hypothetical protein OHK0029_01070 [Armatimonadaceae bacterium]
MAKYPGGWSLDLTTAEIISQTFTGGSITIRDNNTALPYPSTIEVTDVFADLFDLQVTIENFSHTFPSDVDVLLVGPEGQSVILMYENGGQGTATNVDLRFTDFASATLPTPLVSGTYRPTTNTAFFSLPGPAPSLPYGNSLLQAFQGTNLNGTWSLYVRDAFAQDFGSIGSWGLTFITADAGAAAPEPGTLFLVGFGAIAAGTLLRRRIR